MGRSGDGSGSVNRRSLELVEDSFPRVSIGSVPERFERKEAAHP